MPRDARIGRRSRFCTALSILFASGLVVSTVVSCTTDVEDERAEIEFLFDTGRAEEAMPRLEALVDQYPDDLELNRLYGSALVAIGSPEAQSDTAALLNVEKEPELILDATEGARTKGDAHVQAHCPDRLSRSGPWPDVLIWNE